MHFGCGHPPHLCLTLHLPALARVRQQRSEEEVGVSLRGSEHNERSRHLLACGFLSAPLHSCCFDRIHGGFGVFADLDLRLRGQLDDHLHRLHEAIRDAVVEQPRNTQRGLYSSLFLPLVHLHGFRAVTDHKKLNGLVHGWRHNDQHHPQSLAHDYLSPQIGLRMALPLSRDQGGAEKNEIDCQGIESTKKDRESRAQVGEERAHGGRGKRTC